MNLTKCKKIVIVGNSGAGKSTLSHKLGKLLKINVFTIDKIYWLPGWKIRDKHSFKKLHDEWLNQKAWIIDGIGYMEELECRISEADAVIYLDTPVSLCKKRAKARMLKEQFNPDQNVSAGCCYSNVKKLQMKVIDDFCREVKPDIINYLSNLDPDKVIFITHLDELSIKT